MKEALQAFLDQYETQLGVIDYVEMSSDITNNYYACIDDLASELKSMGVNLDRID